MVAAALPPSGRRPLRPVHHADLGLLRVAGIYFFTVNSLGQGAFHILGCVERYLFRGPPRRRPGAAAGGGARIRRVSVGCVVAPRLAAVNTLIVFSCAIVLFLAVLALCSGLVLRALVHPRPDEGGGRSASSWT